MVAGAWITSWCWERAALLIEEVRYRVIMPDLLDAGMDLMLLSTVSLADWPNPIANIVQAQAAPVVFVRHSRASIVISEVAGKRRALWPRVDVECTRDRAPPLEVQRSAKALLACDPVVTLVTDCSPGDSAPAALTQVLLTSAQMRVSQWPPK
jgi:hypothetical protein